MLNDLGQVGVQNILVNNRILSSIVRTFYVENYAEIFPVHYPWKVPEKGFKMAFMMNKLARINSCEIILKNKNDFFLPYTIMNFRCTLYLNAHYT